MARYRVVYTIPSPTGEATGVEFVDADTMQQAVVKVMLENERIAVQSVSLDVRDPSPTATITALARALVRCNSVLLALLNDPVFAGALQPGHLESLKVITTEAQQALALAGMVTS